MVGTIHGEGLLLVPIGAPPVADVIAIPDADQTPEMLCGLEEGVPKRHNMPGRWLSRGCRVLVPALIDRKLEQRNGRAMLTTREYLYRSAFELGRHLIGYEVQKVLAGVDWLAQEQQAVDPWVVVVGWGEGGMLALFSAALDPRIDVTCVSGYFEPRENLADAARPQRVWVAGTIWRRGTGHDGGAAHADRRSRGGPASDLSAGPGGGRRSWSRRDGAVRHEVERAKHLVPDLTESPWLHLVVSAEGAGPYLTGSTLQTVAVHQAGLPDRRCGC